MILTTCKGSFVGTAAECSAWLEHMQPSMVAVVHEGFEESLEGAEGTVEGEDAVDANGCWRDGPSLRAILFEAECAARSAGPQVVEFHEGLAVRVADDGAAELAREVYAAADEGGTIQAEQMLALFPWGDPRWHTTTSLRDALGYVGKVFSPCDA